VKKGDRALRLDEFGDMLQVSVPVVEEFIASGALRAFRFPTGELRLDPRSVQDFLLACELDLRKHFISVDKNL
jgi:hypothetical protein